MTSSKEKGIVQQDFWGCEPFCTIFSSLAKPSAFSHKFSALRTLRDATGGTCDESSPAGLGWGRMSQHPRGWAGSKGALGNQTGNGLFRGFLHHVSPCERPRSLHGEKHNKNFQTFLYPTHYFA